MTAARRARRIPTARVLTIGALIFVAALVVIWRRGAGTRVQRHIGALEVSIADLESRRRTLRAEIRQLSSEERIRDVASRRLGLRRPAETQLIDLPRAAPASSTDSMNAP